MKMLLGLFAAVGVLAAFLDARHSPPPPRSTAAPTLAQDLHGLSLDQVLRRVGVPDSISTSAQDLAFHYDDPAGDVRILFHDGVAVHAEPAQQRVTAGPAAPVRGVYLGQAVEELADRGGNPSSVLQGHLTSELVYADGSRVTLAQGRVVSIQ